MRQAWAILERVEATLILLLLLVCFVARIPRVRFFPDESQWIYSSVAFEKFVKLQWSSPVWQESYWTLTQPPLTRYVIGLGRRLGGHTTVNSPWRFYLSTEENVARGAMPSTGLLWWSRLPMAVLSALSCWAWYLWLRRGFGRLAGWVWAVDCLVSQYLATTLGRAMGEAVLLAVVTAAAWAGARALSQRASGRTLLWFGLFGLLAGTAGATKLNGLALIACGVVLAAARAHIHPGAIRSRAALFGAATLLVVVGGVVAFVAWNPFLYHDPVGRGLKMLQQRTSEMALQIVDYPQTVMPEGWAHWARVIWDLAQRDAPLPLPALLPVHLLLGLVGLTRMGREVWLWLTRRSTQTLALVTLGVLGVAGVPTLFTRLDWQRYSLLPELLLMLCMATGFAWLADAALNEWQKKHSPA